MGFDTIEINLVKICHCAKLRQAQTCRALMESLFTFCLVCQDGHMDGQHGPMCLNHGQDGYQDDQDCCPEGQDGHQDYHQISQDDH